MFKFCNTNHPKKRFEATETSRVKVREILGLSAPMNKIGLSTYLSNYKESLIVLAADIEGGNGLPLDSNYIL